MQQVVTDAALGEQLARAVERVAFADASQVDFNARLQEAKRARLAIELDEVAANRGAGGGQRLGVGNGAARRVKPHTFDSRPDVTSYAPPVSR